MISHVLYHVYLCEVGQCHESKCSEGEGSGADSDGDSPALLATTFPRWPAATMAARRDAQLINALSKLGRTHMGY